MAVCCESEFHELVLNKSTEHKAASNFSENSCSKTFDTTETATMSRNASMPANMLKNSFLGEFYDKIFHETGIKWRDIITIMFFVLLNQDLHSVIIQVDGAIV